MKIFGKLFILFIFAVGSFGFPAFAQTTPALTKFKDTKIRLAYKGKSAIVDLDHTGDITLGSVGRHRYKIFFTKVENDKIYFLFQVQGGSPMTNPMGRCGGDSPQTLIWLKADLKLRVEDAKSEIFASCAYGSGRYQQGETRVVGGSLQITFEQQGKKYHITYDNRVPQYSFEVREP